MAKRIKVGIIYNYDENWIGGAYYIQNLIRSLNYLPEKEQIDLYVLAYDYSLFQELKNNTGYPKLKFIRYKPHFNRIEKFINRVSQKLFKKKAIVKIIELDWIFPIYEVPNDLKHIENLIFWIPDLQEKYLPNFFSAGDVQYRQFCYEKMISSGYPIVFSSQAALNDFNAFHPNSKNNKKVLQFAVVHPIIEDKSLTAVKLKYGLEGDYFISPNQFWQHKNQIAIIEAVKILRDKNVKVKIVFTGKEYDYRNPNYTDFLKEKVTSYGLDNQILFLGFIDRNEQLLLMKNALAIIQPSLFEGWSTVVEDAKALNQTIIVSDIAVHQEQLEDKGYYFPPHDYLKLALQIVAVLEHRDQKIKYEEDYTENIKRFGLKFKQLTDLK